MSYFFTRANSALIERNATGTLANSGFTFAMWYKVAVTNGTLISMAMTGSIGTTAHRVEVTNTGAFPRLLLRTEFSVADGRWSTTPITGVLTVGSIQHLSISYDGASTANTPVFVSNGSNYGVNRELAPSGVMDMTYDDITIGNRMDTLDSFDGEIMEVVIYNTNLTLQEQLILYSPVKYIPLQIRPNNIMAYWPMDDFPNNATPSGANTVRDRSSSNFNMTPTGTLQARGNKIITNP